jgi:hypothetical protein
MRTGVVANAANPVATTDGSTLFTGIFTTVSFDEEDVRW